MLAPVSDEEIRAKLEHHWETAGDTDQGPAHAIYHQDCVVDWPQSGERIRGRDNLQALRSAYPAKLEFSVRRIVGGGDLWITEYVISYSGNPVNVVSIMEFREGLVARETHYFADPFEPAEWRSRWVEPM
jgi:SnoaL-like domain